MPASLRRTLAIAVFATLLVLGGCSGSQSGVRSAESGTGGDAPPASSNEVSQTGERAAAEGTSMPMDREVQLLEIQSPVAPLAEDSETYARRILADTLRTSVDSIDARVEALLAQMTLREKVGQMTQLELGTLSRRDTFPQPLNMEAVRTMIHDYHIGSVLNVVDAAFTLDQWHERIRTIQEEAADTRLGIPIVYGIDAMHGVNYTREAVLFPQSQGMAATWNLALAERAAEITARDVRASGIPWNFAPVLDVGRDYRWPRFYETPGEDVYLTRTMGLAAVHGLQGDRVDAPDRTAATLKHFIGYSGSEDGRDRTPARIPETELREHYLPPFRAAVEAGAASIMVNSGEVNGVPVHSSHSLLTDLLRDELGFEGVVVTDWLDVKKLVSLHRVAADEREATKMAVQAGIDMSMVPSDTSFVHHLTNLVQDGEISEARIDASVRRILEMKMELGLFEDPMAGIEQADAVGSDADRQVALQAAHESITLLRNTDDLLPLTESQRILVTGPTAHSMQSLNNGWTYTWQGGGRAQTFFHEGRPTLMEAVRERVGEAQMTYVPGATLQSPDRMEAAVTAAQEADVAVVALGEGAYTETAGNLRDLALPEAQRTLLRRVAATGTPVVLVLIQGRPRHLGTAHEGADAILNAYNPGTEGGQALTDVLFGDVNPSGHLPYTYPDRATGWVPYNHKPSARLAADFSMNGADPLFAFGAGGSYTTFAIDTLQVQPAAVSAEALTAGETVTVQVTVANTGDRAGKDVVQLYLRDRVASVTPAVRRLVRFAKVDLEPGERRTLTFTLDADALSFIGRDGTPTLESGMFDVMVESTSVELEVE